MENNNTEGKFFILDRLNKVTTFFRLAGRDRQPDGNAEAASRDEKGPETSFSIQKEPRQGE